ncbi:MAG: LysR family transcriptional regulator [Sneathiella sp.]
MTLEQLIVLDAIVKQGTFRGAADYLNKSQSALSHMLKKLELELDLTLLSREEYRPKLTSAGEVFYRQATRVLRDVQDLKAVAQSLNAKQEAEVMLAVTATFPLQSLLALIASLTQEFPATHIRLSRENLGGTADQLLNGSADIIISTLQDMPLDQVDANFLGSVTMCPVAHPDFGPAQKPGMNSIGQMQAHIQVVVADSGRQEVQQSKGLLPGGLRWTVSDFAAKKDILLANMGWGGMPEHLIEEELKNGSLVRLNVEGYPPIQVPHYLVKRKDKIAGVVAQSIWERLLKV